MQNSHDVGQMVGVYKRLFILLVSVTALGILLSALKMPIGVTVAIALAIIAFKGKIVFDAFKGLLTGKNALVLLFSLTLFFFLLVLLLPLFNHENTLLGTVDISKQIQSQEKPMEEHHGH